MKKARRLGLDFKSVFMENLLRTARETETIFRQKKDKFVGFNILIWFFYTNMLQTV